MAISAFDFHSMCYFVGTCQKGGNALLKHGPVHKKPCGDQYGVPIVMDTLLKISRSVFILGGESHSLAGK